MTELIWDGKYRDGKRVPPVRIALPFQTVETVNESTRDRARTLDLFASGKPTEWRNRLIWGDKKYVLPSLLPEFAGKVNLVYIDPPFDTGADFAFTAKIPDSTASIEKLPSMIEQKAYRDTWGRGLDSYLQWFSDGTQLLRDLLTEDGAIYVHLDYHVSHYARAVLDEIFGAENFRNEIVWLRSKNPKGSQHGLSRYSPFTDTLLYYVRSAAAPIHLDRIRVPLDADEMADKYPYSDAHGPFADGPMLRSDSMGPRPNLVYTYKGFTPGPAGWRVERTVLEEIDKAGNLNWTKEGVRRKLRPSTDKGDPIGSFWGDIPPVNSQADERVGYPTQKPRPLLERILMASSNPGDLVLDCFCGSGTTADVAERLGRRWIACDLGRFAIHTTRKRMLEVEKVTPFVVQNLGKYERQAWMAAELKNPKTARPQSAYREFILDLYRADPIAGQVWLHGVKSGRFVHVGAVDAPVTLADVKAIAGEVWRVAGKAKNGNGHKAAVDILGWEFAFELNEMAKQTAAEARVDVSFKAIPRDVLDKKAIKDIQAKDFFELRVFSTKSSVKKRVASVELVDFMMPAEDLPEDVRKAVKHWSQWIDYWAIDWDFKGDTFHNEWQSYRTKEEPKLELAAQREYKEPGTYSVMIKVIDLLGCDTTKMIALEVK